MTLKKYCNLLLVLLVFIMTTSHYTAQSQISTKTVDPSLFITEWDLSKELTISSYEDNTSIGFYLKANADVNYTWVSSDNTTGSGTINRGSEKVEINNLPAGQKITLSLESKNLIRFFNYSTTGYLQNLYAKKLIDVKQWGDTKWTSFEYAFYYCTNLNISATDIPDLSNVKSMKKAFYQCNSLTNPHNINKWDTSNVTNMYDLFYKAYNFNGDVSTWNTTNVTDMYRMFYKNYVFNQDISQWNTAKVIYMRSMFNGASIFNQDISKWNTSSVKVMTYMFSDAINFNQDISKWDVSKVTDMGYIFANAKIFNQDISNWNTSNVENMEYMFADAYAFNQDISNWNLSKLKYTTGMFSGAKSFNQNISNWDVSGVTYMQNMFSGASSFNQDISQWNYQPEINLDNMINGTALDCANYSALLHKWASVYSNSNSQKLDATGLFYSTNTSTARQRLINNGWQIYGDKEISTPCTTINDQFITQWDLSKEGSPVVNGLTSISFYLDSDGITEFTLRSGNVFYLSDIILPNENKEVVISGIPANLNVILSIPSNKIKSFYMSNKETLTPNTNSRRLVDVKQWGTTEWTDLTAAFAGCTNLNITALDTPNLSNTSSTAAMFYNTTSLTGPANIGQWDTSHIQDMSKMFKKASLFNQAINTWNVSNVQTMSEMFYESTAFNQNLSLWQFNPKVNLSNMLSLSGIDCYHYSTSLLGWANNTNTPNDLTLGSTSIVYNTNAALARQKLIDKNWTIDGDTESDTRCISYFITEWDLSKVGSSVNSYKQTTSISFDLLSGNHVDYKWETTDGTSSGSGTIEPGIYRPYQATINNLPANKKIILSLDSELLIRFVIDSYNCERLVDVKQWGEAYWYSMESAFYRSVNLNITATDIPNLSRVTNMSSMFEGASIFNIPSNFGNWDVSNVQDMSKMFNGAKKFNQNISQWDMSNVTNMKSMLTDTYFFNQNLGDWQINPAANLEAILDNSNLDCSNYSATLQGWADNPNTPDNRTLGAKDRTYGTDAALARQKLIDKGWTIKDDIAGSINCNSTLSTEANTNSTTKTKIILYPNPVRDIINLQTSEKVLAAEVYSFNGNKIINTIPTSDNKLNTNHLKPGIYILKIYTKQQVESIKFIKE